MSQTEALLAVCAETDRYDPTTLEINGTPWGCATDGWRMLAIRGARVDGMVADTVRETFAKHILAKSPTQPRTLSRAKLAAWVGEPPVDPERTPCSRCDSTGAVECSACDGTGDCECTCGHEHPCRECDGDGEVKCNACKNTPESRSQRSTRRVRVGTVGGFGFNRTLFHEALAVIESDEVTVELPENPKNTPLVIRSADRSVLFAVMMTDATTSADMPELLR